MEMSINGTANVHEVRPNKTSRKLQLWTNQSKTKYAISFENDLSYLAKTDPEVMQYTTVIAESDTIFKGHEYDWKYILNKWIDNHKFATGFKNRSKFFFSHPEDVPKYKIPRLQRQGVNHHSTLQPWMAKNILWD